MKSCNLADNTLMKIKTEPQDEDMVPSFQIAHDQVDDKPQKPKTTKKAKTDAGGDQEPFLPPCRVCGGVATGYHFGAITCEACKVFFRRSYSRGYAELYSCKKEGNCKIQSGRRSSCSFCRLKRCKALGMALKNVRKGRYSSATKTQCILQAKRAKHLREAGLEDQIDLLAFGSPFEEDTRNTEISASSPPSTTSSVEQPDLLTHHMIHGNNPRSRAKEGISVDSQPHTVHNSTKHIVESMTYNAARVSPMANHHLINTDSCVPLANGSKLNRRILYQSITPIKPSPGKPLLPKMVPYHSHISKPFNASPQRPCSSKDIAYCSPSKLDDQCLPYPSISTGKSGDYSIPKHSFESILEAGCSSPPEDFGPEISDQMEYSVSSGNSVFNQSKNNSPKIYPHQFRKSPSSSSSISFSHKSDHLDVHTIPFIPSPSLPNDVNDTPINYSLKDSPQSVVSMDIELSTTSTPESGMKGSYSKQDLGKSYGKTSSNLKKPKCRWTSDHEKDKLCENNLELLNARLEQYDISNEVDKKNDELVEYITNLNDMHRLVQPFHLEQFKKREEKYRTAKALQRSLFGIKGPLPDDIYHEIYQATGMDVDGRLNTLENCLMNVEGDIHKFLNLMKYIPGMESICTQDRVTLSKSAGNTFWWLSTYFSINVEEKILHCHSCSAIHNKEELGKLYTQELIDAMFNWARRVQAMDITREEVSMLIALTILSTDCQVQPLIEEDVIEKHHEILLNAFLHHLKLTRTQPMIHFARLMQMMTEMQDVIELHRTCITRWLGEFKSLQNRKLYVEITGNLQGCQE